MKMEERGARKGEGRGGEGRGRERKRGGGERRGGRGKERRGEGRGEEEGPYSQADGESSCASPGEIAQRCTLSGLQSVGGRLGKTITLQSIAPAGRGGALEEWEETKSTHSTSIRTAA